jgi:hypothetical protein
MTVDPQSVLVFVLGPVGIAAVLGAAVYWLKKRRR